MKEGFVYMVANKKDGTLYIGVTSNLLARIHQHKNKTFVGFSAKYRLNKLVYFEHHLEIAEAANRERQIKNWRREWKIALIEKDNPHWTDLSLSIGYDVDCTYLTTADPELDSGSNSLRKIRLDPESSSGCVGVDK